MLTHAHADHGQGLKAIMQKFGTKQFWYSKSANWGSMGTLLNFARRSSNVEYHQAIDSNINLPDMGDVKLDVLWPEDNSSIGLKQMLLSITKENQSGTSWIRLFLRLMKCHPQHKNNILELSETDYFTNLWLS